VTFLQISRKPQLRSQNQLHLQKANEQMFQTIYAYENNVKFSLTSRIQKWPWPRDLFEFCQIIDNISEMVQYRDSNNGQLIGKWKSSMAY